MRIVREENGEEISEISASEFNNVLAEVYNNALEDLKEKTINDFKELQFKTGRAWFDFDAGIDRCVELLSKNQEQLRK